MRKILLAVLLIAILAVPCFAHGPEGDKAVSADVPPKASALEGQIMKLEMTQSAALLLKTGRETESPILLAAAAELVEGGEVALKDEDGKDVTAANIYKEAVALAQSKKIEGLAGILEAQSKFGATKHGGHPWMEFGPYFDLVYRVPMVGWHSHPRW